MFATLMSWNREQQSYWVVLLHVSNLFLTRQHHTAMHTLHQYPTLVNKLSVFLYAQSWVTTQYYTVKQNIDVQYWPCAKDNFIVGIYQAL